MHKSSDDFFSCSTGTANQNRDVRFTACSSFMRTACMTGVEPKITSSGGNSGPEYKLCSVSA